MLTDEPRMPFVDLRLTLRALRAHPGYTLAAVGTLALGIAATTAMLSAVYAVLLAPQPVHEPSRIVAGWGLAPETSHGLVELTYRDIDALGRDSRTVQSMAAVGSTTWSAVLEGDGVPARLAYGGVSGTFFATLGVPPARGRTLQPADDMPGAAGVVVLSHATWRDRFGADASIVGRAITLDGAPQTIVGVMPDGFDYPRGAEFWAPIAPTLAAASALWKTDALATVGVLFYVARLRDGVSLDAAAEDLSAVGRRLDEGRPAPRVGSRVMAMPFEDHVLGPVRQALWALLGAVGVLLLIAGVNVSGLMLTRASRARREHAIRLAIGASGRDLARLWLTESAVIAVLGGVLGLLCASTLTTSMLALAPEGIPRLAGARVNLPVAAVALVVTALAAIGCALAPLRLARNVGLTDPLGEAGRGTAGSRPRRWRTALLVVQIAMAVVLLVTAGLVTRSFRALRAVDLGFQPAQVLSLQIDPRIEATGVNAWMSTLVEALASHPAIQHVGAVALRPLGLGPVGQGTTVILEGQPETPASTAANPLLNYQVVTPGYFDTMRIAVLAGRVFTTDDRDGSERVAVVGASAARRLWPGRSAVGQRLLTSSFDRRDGAPKTAWRRVVGVVADVRYRGLGEVSLDLYDPHTQVTQAATDLVVRTDGPPLAAAAIVNEQVRRLAPGAIVDGVTTFDTLVSRAWAPWRFGAWVFSLFAAVATALTAIGLFSAVALDVAERRREFAVRVALGASAAAVARGVARAVGTIAAAGLLVGLATATLATAAVQGLLFGVPRADPATYAGVALGLALVVTVATWVPMRRAMRVAPAELLREG